MLKKNIVNGFLILFIALRTTSEEPCSQLYKFPLFPIFYQLGIPTVEYLQFVPFSFDLSKIPTRSNFLPEKYEHRYKKNIFKKSGYRSAIQWVTTTSGSL